MTLLPGTVSRLIFGADLREFSEIFARIAGIALLSLAVGCAPTAWLGHRPPALAAMLALNAMLFAYLAVIGVLFRYDGLLFWPAVILHGLLAAAMAFAWHRQRPLGGPEKHDI